VGWGGLNGLHIVDEATVWVVGSWGQVSYTDDGAQSWSDRSVPSDRTMNDVFFRTATNGFVVGGRGEIWCTDDGGMSWMAVSHLAGNEDLNAITFTSADVGWIGGDNGTALYTDDGGASWSVLTTNWSNDVAVADPMADDNVAFGTERSGGVFVGAPPGNWRGIFGADVVMDVLFTDANNGKVLYLDGSSYYIGTITAGTWTHDKLSLPQAPGSMAFNGSNAVLVGWWGMIMHSGNGGATWNDAYGMVHNGEPWATQLWDVGFDGDVGLAVGTAGAILRSDDGGVTWENRPSGATEDLFGVWIHGNTAMAVGRGAEAIRSTDGGMSWSDMPSPVVSEWIRDVSMWDENNAILVGNGEGGLETIYVTDDGGDSWTHLERGVSPAEQSVFLCVWTHGTGHAWMGGRDGLVVSVTGRGDSLRSTDSGTVRGIFEIQFLDENTGWGATQSQDLVKTTDGGATWELTRLLTGSLWEAHFRDANNGVGVGPTGGVYGSSDGGLTWERQHSGLNTWSHVRAVWMENATDGVIVGTETKILYTRTAGRLP
jgi:photosystem II stability/assembly factor-like uncharacterized protein